MGTDWLRQRSLKELFLDAGDGPVEEGLVEASSGSSASKLRLQDLSEQEERSQMQEDLNILDLFENMFLTMKSTG